MTETRIPSSLGRYQGRAASSPQELHKMAAAAWHERHVLVIGLDDPDVILSEMDRGYLEAVGIEQYGKRDKK